MLVSAVTGGSYLGDIWFKFIPSAAQTGAANASPADPAVFQVLVRNDSTYARGFKVKSVLDAAAGWAVNCRVGGTDIGPDLFGTPGYTTAVLDPGASETILVEMIPNRVVTVGAVRSLGFQLLGGDAVNAPLDSVRVDATVSGLVRPDLLVRRAGEAIEAGDNLYNTTGIGQQRRLRVDPGATATYLTRLTNDGNSAERILVTGTAASAGWSVAYLHDRNYANFDGNDDYINVGAWGPGTQWTTEAWVRPSALPAGRHSIAGGFNDGRDWGITLQEGKFGVAFKPISGASTLTQLAPDPAVVGQWIHVAGTCDGTTARLYLNGVEVASGLVQVGYVGTTASTRIGGESCCTMPVFITTQLCPIMRVHWRAVRKLRRDFDHRLVDEYGHGIQIARVSLEPEPLRLQRQRPTAGKGIVERGQLLAVEQLRRPRVPGPVASARPPQTTGGIL